MTKIIEIMDHVRHMFVSLTNTGSYEWVETWVIPFRDSKIRNESRPVIPQSIPP